MTLIVEITVSGSTALRERWQEVESAIASSFADAKFSGNFRAGRPVEHTREVVFGSQSEDFCHVIAVGEIDQLYGAFFYLPTRRLPGQYDWEPG